MCKKEEIEQFHQQTPLIEVFRTNLNTEKEANLAHQVLAHLLPNAIISFDLEDCDRILRIETQQRSLNEKMVIKQLESVGILAEVLE